MAVQKPLVLIGGELNQLPAGDTLSTDYTHPSGDGNLHVPANSTTNSGKVLTASGVAGTYTWETSVGGLNATAIKTAAYTALANDLVRVDSAAGAFTVTLPTSPLDSEKVGLFDISNSCGTNPVLLAAAGGKTLEGDVTGLSVNVNGAYVYLIYNSDTTNWKVAETPNASTGIHAETVGFTATAGLTPKTLTVLNSLTLSGTDSSTLDIGTGGTLGTSAYTNNIMTTAGDIIYGGVAGAPTRLGIGSATTVLHGGASAPTYSAIVEDDISLSANTTNNATTVRHGFLPQLSNNAIQFLNGQGNFATPSAGAANSYSLTAFSGQTSVNVIHNFGTYPIVQIMESTAVIIPFTVTHNTLNDFTVTFSASTTGSIIASVGSPQPQAVIIVTGNYTVLVTDRIVQLTASGKTLTLPTAVGNTGREFKLKNSSTNFTYVNTTSSQLIDGVLIQTLPALSSMTVYSDGSNWGII